MSDSVVVAKESFWERCRTPAGLLAMLLACIKYGVESWDKASLFFEHVPFISKLLASRITTPILFVVGVVLILWELSTLRKQGDQMRRHLRTHLVDSVKVVALLILVFGLIFILAFVLQPKSESSGKQQEPSKPTEAKPEDKKSDKKGQESTKQPPNPDIRVGRVDQGPCSNLQIGGSNNQQTTNCGPQLPAARVIPSEKLTSLCDELKRAIGSVQIVSFTDDDAEDVSNLYKQLKSAFRCATWSVVYPAEYGDANKILVNTNEGSKRLGGKSLVCAAKEKDNEIASNAVIALGNAGLTCLSDSDFYAPYGPDILMANVKPTLVILISKRMPK